MKSPQEIEQIRNVRILDLLKMKETGRKQMIKCPFHGDRTPSCVIYPDNSYHCFGCSAHGGNAIDFVMGLGADFKEALIELEKFI